LGPKKVKFLFQKFNINSLYKLQKLLKSHKLLKLDGWSEKSEKNLLKSINFYKRYNQRFLLGETYPLAQEILEEIKQNSCFLQLEDLQEKTDNPHSQRVKSVIFNGLTESKNIKIFNPGNEVRVIGILKDVPIFKNNKKTVFHNWILEIKSAELIEKDIDIDAFSKD